MLFRSTVYDSIITETKNEYVEQVQRLMREQMEMKPHPDFNIKIRADIDVYQKWGLKMKKDT